MWILYAHYDGEHAPMSARVLHSGKSLKVGRKADLVDLLIPIGRISRWSGTLQIEAVPLSYVSQGGARARVTWTMRTGSKSGSFIESFRGRNRIEQRIQAETPVELTDQSRICLVSGVYAELRWLSFSLSVYRVPSLDSEDVRSTAALLGIHVTSVQKQLSAASTHLVVSCIRPSKEQLLALVYGIPVVSEAYVQALFGAGMAPAWHEPDASGFVPPSDPNLARDAQIPREQLTPRPERRHIYADAIVCMWIPKPSRRFLDLAELAEAAGAFVHVHDLSKEHVSDALTARQVLANCKEQEVGCDAKRRMYVITEDAPVVDQACQTLKLPLLPDGMWAIPRGILDVQKWSTMVRPYEPDSAQQESDATCDVTSWMDDLSGVPDVNVTTSEDMQPVHASHTSSSLVPSTNAASTLEPASSSRSSESNPQQRVPTSRATRLSADDALAPLASQHTNRPCTLPRRAPRRSYLLDELLGVPRDEQQSARPAGPASVASSSPSQSDGERRSAKFRQMLDSSQSVFDKPVGKELDADDALRLRAKSSSEQQRGTGLMSNESNLDRGDEAAHESRSHAPNETEAATVPDSDSEGGLPVPEPHAEWEQALASAPACDSVSRSSCTTASAPPPSSWNHIERPSFMQVRIEPMARPSHSHRRNFKKFRRTNTCAPRRVPVVLDLPDAERAASSDAVLFLGDDSL